MSTNKIHCHIYHWSVRGEMRWGFVTNFERSISRGQSQSRNISTQIYHVCEWRHSEWFSYAFQTFHLAFVWDKFIIAMATHVRGSASPWRKDVSIGQKEALSLFSPLRRSFGWARNSPITQLEHIRTCLTLNPNPRFDTSTNQNQPTSCHLYWSNPSTDSSSQVHPWSMTPETPLCSQLPAGIMGINLLNISATFTLFLGISLKLGCLNHK